MFEIVMRWTKEEVNYLIENYSLDIPIENICNYLKKSKKSIRHKAARLSLSRPTVPSNKPKNKNHRNEVDKRYYLKNKKRIYENKKLRELRYKWELIEMLGGKCQKCGYNKCHVAFDFHHKDSNKENSISVMLKWVSKEKILKEAKKCILLCANCHRELHYKGA